MKILVLIGIEQILIEKDISFKESFGTLQNQSQTWDERAMHHSNSGKKEKTRQLWRHKCAVRILFGGLVEIEKETETERAERRKSGVTKSQRKISITQFRKRCNMNMIIHEISATFVTDTDLSFRYVKSVHKIHKCSFHLDRTSPDCVNSCELKVRINFGYEKHKLINSAFRHIRKDMIKEPIARYNGQWMACNRFVCCL